MDRRDIQAKLEKSLERLSSIEHERWAHWQSYMHSKAELQSDGSMIVPAELVAQWTRQIETPYENLTHEEQESDRDQVRRYIPAVVDALTAC